MVSTLRLTSRTPFKQRFKVIKSSRSNSQVRHRLVNLLLGRSPKDSCPEATEEATKWLNSVVGELESDLPAKSG